ncbi:MULTISPECIES: DUF739 family protein [Helcococcus]|uniref:DUF739 family protein n=1 Tax=Helcococcus bovis TaxID=3153252 RepID=A0ABW9F708_9FIRM
MKFNYNKLKGKIVTNGLNIPMVADMLKISRQSLYARLANEIPFKDYEIAKLKEILNIQPEEMDCIFFDVDVR